MYHIAVIKTWIQCFFLTMCFALFSISHSMAEDKPVTGHVIALEKAIEDYKKISENGGWPAFEVGKTIKLGMQDSRVPMVRDILSIMGDYKATEKSDPQVLDEELVKAIKQFQQRHGLEMDGDIGKKTQTQLAVPIANRIAQMQASLENMKQFQEPHEKYILVNVAGYFLEAVQNQNIMLKSRVIVGTPKNSTPLFTRPIIEVSFNPAWYVPPRIAREEMIQKLQDEPEYFTKGNFVVKDSKGEQVDIETIDWEVEDGSDFKFVQLSGEKNALGKVKFNLPDTNNIYLHSTGNPKLFNKAVRSLSHGCIRVEKARELVSFVMLDNEKWDEERIDTYYNSKNSRIFKVDPVPVHLVYWTSWVDEETKQPNFYPDIYSRDNKRVSEIIAENNKPVTN